MVFHGLINYRYALNDWRHDVVPAVWCIDSHPSNSRHPFFQPNCKSIMVMPMIVKEFDNFFSDQVAVFCPNFVQNCEFRFSPDMLNFLISFVFRPKRIFCVPMHRAEEFLTDFFWWRCRKDIVGVQVSWTLIRQSATCCWLTQLTVSTASTWVVWLTVCTPSPCFYQRTWPGCLFQLQFYMSSPFYFGMCQSSTCAVFALTIAIASLFVGAVVKHSWSDVKSLVPFVSAVLQAC